MLGKLFGKKKEKLKENEVRIVLPEESYTLIEYKNDSLPCIAAINSSLLDFEHRDIFRWHLSVIIDFNEGEIIDNGMPSEEERKIVDPFCDKLDEEIKAGGNALFLVRETWNKTRRLVWMVYDPEIANQHLQYLIEHYQYPRQFDYRMEEDIEWKQPEWYFRAVRT
ncbi:MAG: DUF695 domain-containing protein [Methylophaga sp.]|mgnify:CR=1 FL=1|uniref:DUF695 domain-containing protein n=1 Tax=Methylophaga sp. UBA678 TaxID=1946901 RepID=UPI000C61240B|nr:DUF695 domain-containing protein [Methylophaga sp. UBA678]MAX53437.1 DUF695 domain-containing protein [Methylophaga sp.]